MEKQHCEKYIKSERTEFSVADNFPVIMFAAGIIAVCLLYFDLVPESLIYGQKGKKGYIERCIGGVSYIDTGRGITPRIDKTSSPVVCAE